MIPMHTCKCLALACGQIVFCPTHAAAPAMLEALEVAEKCMANLPHSWGVDIAELPRIRAAIRAAKGETK